MKVIYACDQFESNPNSIMLCGGTPRSEFVKSWRPEALQILDSMNFNGQVLVPESSTGRVSSDYLNQVEWEYKALESAGCIAFWVNRDMLNFFCLTTNVEFGRYVGSGKAIYGRPEGAPHTSYLDWLYQKLNNRGPHKALYETLRGCINFLELVSAF
jgi:hypothetical protein